MMSVSGRASSARMALRTCDSGPFRLLPSAMQQGVMSDRVEAVGAFCGGYGYFDRPVYGV